MAHAHLKKELLSADTRRLTLSTIDKWSIRRAAYRSGMVRPHYSPHGIGAPWRPFPRRERLQVL